MANSGISKFTNHMYAHAQLPKAGIKFTITMVESGWLLILVGIVEITRGVFTDIPKKMGFGRHDDYTYHTW